MGVSVYGITSCAPFTHGTLRFLRNKGNGRLGLSTFPRSSAGGIPFPTRLVVPGARLVSLVAGGW
jgi:hypothetical protein